MCTSGFPVSNCQYGHIELSLLLLLQVFQNVSLNESWFCVLLGFFVFFCGFFFLMNPNIIVKVRMAEKLV